jgi:hypothetical protein
MAAVPSGHSLDSAPHYSQSVSCHLKASRVSATCTNFDLANAQIVPISRDEHDCTSSDQSAHYRRRIAASRRVGVSLGLEPTLRNTLYRLYLLILFCLSTPRTNPKSTSEIIIGDINNFTWWQRHYKVTMDWKKISGKTYEVHYAKKTETWRKDDCDNWRR